VAGDELGSLEEHAEAVVDNECLVIKLEMDFCKAKRCTIWQPLHFRILKRNDRWGWSEQFH
jgi:hypothetical protein